MVEAGNGGDSRPPPSDAELQLCADVLKRLSPAQLRAVGTEESPAHDALREVRDAGLQLFRSLAIEERFGQSDVVEFLRSSHGKKKDLRKLEKLEKEIQKVHQARCEDSASCGINADRERRFADTQARAGVRNHHHVTAASWEASRYAPRWAPRGPGDGTGGRGLALPPPAFRGTWRDHGSEEEPEAREETGDASPAEAPELEGEQRSTEVSKPVPPPGDFRLKCLVCRLRYTELHRFYHELCPQCGDYNFAKRSQTADLRGYVCVVTGGRVRIGYEIVLKLLRAGARVLATTRFPQDAALRYSREADFERWRERLELLGPLELADLRSVEGFCELLGRRFKRIHVLINNAAQTLTRPAGWDVRMQELEDAAARQLPPSARALLPRQALQGPEAVPLQLGQGEAVPAPEGASGSAAAPDLPEQEVALAPGSDDQVLCEWQLRDFPAGLVDESAQPLDLSRSNSWSRRLGEVDTVELLRTLAANAAAPFVLCSKLRPLLAPDVQDTAAPWGHIVNVSALEGQFSVGRKACTHPHTNMSKAALNMLTVTCAADLARHRVLVNAVDTGWVTDMAPGGKGRKAALHETHVGPPLDEEDGAARVLDPVFMHVLSGFKEHGLFWKHYRVASW